jgi:hypothetical protein
VLLGKTFLVAMEGILMVSNVMSGYRGLIVLLVLIYDMFGAAYIKM